MNLQLDQIIDNDFLDKDVSELVEGDFYLFHLTDTHVYFYKDGLIGVKPIDEGVEGDTPLVEYTSGSLQEYIESLGDVK